MMQKIEFRHGFYGRSSISGDDFYLTCGATDIHDLFMYKLGARVQRQYIDGCTIFLLGSRQIDVIKKHLKK